MSYANIISSGDTFNAAASRQQPRHVGARLLTTEIDPLAMACCAVQSPEAGVPEGTPEIAV